MKSGQKKGFLLIEALAALALLMVFSLFVASWHGVLGNDRYDLKLELMAQSYAQLYAQRVAAGLTAASSTAHEGAHTITLHPIQTDQSDLYLVQVVVQWHDARNNKKRFSVVASAL